MKIPLMNWFISIILKVVNKLRIVECVPNFSEGRDATIIKAITDAIESVQEISLLGLFRGKLFDKCQTIQTEPKGVCLIIFLFIH